MIHEKIEEVQEYFKSKLIAGDYEELRNDSYKLWVEIDGRYTFILWIANGESHLRLYSDCDDGGNNVLSFMDFELSSSDRKKIWSKRMQSIREKEEKRKADADLREYKRLQKKFASK